jgi:hypothetical protein
VTKRAKHAKKPKARPRATPAARVQFTDDEVDEWIEEDEGPVPESGTPQSNDEIADKYARSQLRVVRETKDFTLDYLQHALKTPSYVINVAPDYQRRQRWTGRKRSLLIESFLMNIPIPPVFLFERDYNSYEVVDGRQRLDTIRDFLDNGFALSGLRYWKELNGKRFKTLPLVIQRGLIRRSIGAVVLLAETRRPTEDDIDVRTVLFDRLNTGGEKLNPQELRNALTPGPFNKLLIDLARSPEFAGLWGIPPKTANEEEDIPSALARNTLYRTMTDCELVLRFFAIRDALTQSHRGSLRRLLDRTMERHKHDPGPVLKELSSDFRKSLVALSDLFDGAPFKLPNSPRPSRPLYDALMVAYSLHNAERRLRPRASIHRRLAKALADEGSYDVLVGRGNTLEAIKERVALAAGILFGAS